MAANANSLNHIFHITMRKKTLLFMQLTDISTPTTLTLPPAPDSRSIWCRRSDIQPVPEQRSSTLTRPKSRPIPFIISSCALPRCNSSARCCVYDSVSGRGIRTPFLHLISRSPKGWVPRIYWRGSARSRRRQSRRSWRFC